MRRALADVRAGQELAPIFMALGDETRLGLVRRLCARSPQSISQLREGTRLTRQAVTKHLRALESAGLVRAARVGREQRFAFEPAAMAQASRFLERVSTQWDETLERLRKFVED